MYQQICDWARLVEAWEKVEAKNTAGGVDRVRVGEFKLDWEDRLKALQKELEQQRYIPEPYLTVKIPKDKGEYRELGLLTVRDKIVQQSILSVIGPVLDDLFLDTSYGYRRDKGPVKAVRRTWHEIHHCRRYWFVNLDFDSFFDNIPLDRLFRRLSKVIQNEALERLISLCMQMAKVDRTMQWRYREKGLAQGALLSPVLANFYLHELDQFMLRYSAGYIRYADDFLILADSERYANEVLRKVTTFIDQTLKLPLNPGAKVAHLNRGTTFLGITFYDDRYGLSDEKLSSVKEKLEQVCTLSDGELPAKYSETLEGIRNYYCRLLPDEYLLCLDEYQEELLESEVKKHRSKWRTQKAVRTALDRLTFLTDVYQQDRKKLIVEWSGRRKKRKPDQEEEVLTIDPAKAIEKKRRMYRKLQSASLELLISQPGVWLGKSRRGITVKQKGRNLLNAPTANVKHISILNKGVTLSSNLIAHCAKADIPIDFFDGRGRIISRIYDPDTVDAVLWDGQLQALNSIKGSLIAGQMVRGKIRNQIYLLKYFNKYQKQRATAFAKTLPEALEKMNAILESIKVGQEADTPLSNYRKSLFGKEGQAAQFYWKMIAQLVRDNVPFPGRKGQGATDLFNAMLNYGYGILYSRIWDAILKARLNPYISFLHTRQLKKPTLTFDLIEEFRPAIVDRTVISMVRKERRDLAMDGDLLSLATRKKLAEKILERLHSFEMHGGEHLRLSTIIRRQARLLARYLLDQQKKYKPYTFKW